MHGRRWMEKRKKEIEKRGRREIIWLRKKRDKEMLKMRERERDRQRDRERDREREKERQRKRDRERDHLEKI